MKSEKIKIGYWVRRAGYQGWSQVSHAPWESKFRGWVLRSVARNKNGAELQLWPTVNEIAEVSKFWPGPIGPVSSLLWEAAKYGEPSINPRALLNGILNDGPTQIHDWRYGMAHGFLATAMDTKGERYAIEHGEDVMVLLQAALLAQDAGY